MKKKKPSLYRRLIIWILGGRVYPPRNENE